MSAPADATPSTNGAAPSRRALVKGAAWAAPILAASTVAPAFAVSCPPEWLSSIGRGKMLSGGLFNINLDTLASVDGVIASAPTVVEEVGFKHAGGIETDPDEHFDPLSVTALQAIEVDLSGTTAFLSDILSIVTPAEVGAVNQYSFAASDGLARGASGYVDGQGTVRTGGSGGYPTLGSLDLKTLLTPLLGAGATYLTDNVANLQLQIGAVAGRAEAEYSCQTNQQTVLTRDYLLAHLRVLIESALIKNLATTVGSAVAEIDIVGVAGLTVDLSVLTNGPLPAGADQPIQADLSAGTITVDIGALLGGNDFDADYSAWLNGREANTLLFVDTPLPSDAVTNFMGGLILGLQDRLLDAVTVTITVSVLGVEIEETGTLRDLKEIPVVGTVLSGLINAINALFTTAGPVKTALDAISGLLATVFGWLKDVVNLRINAQNDPAENLPPTPSSYAEPTRWSSLDAGRYDVAALAVTLAEGFISDAVLDLYLARGSVGPMVVLPK